MSESSSLTTKEVARLCRVSDATVKRWEEAGLLKSERTSGGHRRFRAEEVARFQREQGIGLKIAHGDETAQAAARKRRGTRNHSTSSLFHSLLAGREEETAGILINSYLHGMPLAKVFDEIVSPAMRRIGELWFEGEINVAQEHLATRTVYNAIYKLRTVVPVAESTGKLVFCCALEGDFHELPTHLSQMTFETQGWEVMNFGANTPLYSLTDEILHHAPELICISATVMNDYERIARDYAEFRTRINKLKIPVVLGGRVFDDSRVRQRFPAEFYAETFSHLAEFAQKISQG
jgi:MerR family transcriptional regulator, light-induced transcriptional regulator